MKPLHLVMLLVALVFAGVFVGSLFGGARGAQAGAAAAAALAGVLLWTIAPAQCRRQLDIIKRSGTKVADPHAFRARFIKGARTPAVILVVLALVALVVILAIPH